MIYKYFIIISDKGLSTIFLNISLGTKETHTKIIEEIKKARVISKNLIGLGMIISTHRIITGKIRNDEKDVYLDQNSIVILTADRKYSHLCSHEIIYGNFIDSVQTIEVTDLIKIGEHITLKVIETGKDWVKVVVIKDGLLFSYMNIILLHSKTAKELVYLKTEEIEDLNEAIGYGCDFLIFPCPLNVCVLDYMKAIRSFHNQKPILIAKIELGSGKLCKTEVDYLMKNYDGIWLEDFCSCGDKYLLNDISSILLSNGKHIQCSSHNSSNIMINNNLLTKIDGLVVSDSFIKTSRISIHQTYSKLCKEISWNYKAFMDIRNRYRDIYCEYIRKITLLTFKYDASCIVIINESGKSVLKIAQSRPLIPILASFKNPGSAQKSTILKNVYTINSSSTSLPYAQCLSNQLNNLVALGKRLGFIKYKTQFIFCFQTKLQQEECDAFQILIEDKFDTK